VSACSRRCSAPRPPAGAAGTGNRSPRAPRALVSPHAGSSLTRATFAARRCSSMSRRPVLGELERLGEGLLGDLEAPLVHEVTPELDVALDDLARLPAVPLVLQGGQKEGQHGDERAGGPGEPGLDAPPAGRLAAGFDLLSQESPTNLLANVMVLQQLAQRCRGPVARGWAVPSGSSRPPRMPGRYHVLQGRGTRGGLDPLAARSYCEWAFTIGRWRVAREAPHRGPPGPVDRRHAGPCSRTTVCGA